MIDLSKWSFWKGQEQHNKQQDTEETAQYWVTKIINDWHTICVFFFKDIEKHLKKIVFKIENSFNKK